MEPNFKSVFQTRYKKVEKRFGIVREARSELPVIDVAPLMQGGSDAAKMQVARQIRDAFVNTGFFYMTNYGLTEEEMLELRDLMLRFFHLPLADKQAAECKDMVVARGWIPFGREEITPGYEPDYKEYYDMGLGLEDKAIPEIERGVNTWPAEQVLPEFRTALESHIQRMLTAGQKLMRGMALSLDLPETYFDKCHERPFFNFRPSWYPPAKGKLHDRLWSCGPHTDYMTLTMLYQDHVGGLEVMNLDGDWIPAPPIAGTQVVNIGDMMASWTNDLYTSNPHRVRNLSDEERISIATFMGPDFATEVKCLENCQSADNPPRYAPITCQEHINNIVAQSMPDVAKTADANRSHSEVTDRFRSADRIGAR